MVVRDIRLEDLAALLTLLFFGVAGAIPGIAPNQAAEMTGAPATGLMFAAGIGSQLLVNGLIVALLFRFAPAWWPWLRALQWVGVLAAFAVLSALWSQDAVLTARRAVPFALAAGFGLHLATRYSLAQQLRLLEISFLILAGASAVLALCAPSLGLDASKGHGGNWQGVFTQKNACGRAMVFASAVVLAQTGHTLRRCASLLVFGLVLLMSGSRGAWALEALVCAVLGGFWLLCRFAQRQRVLLVPASLALALACAALAQVYFATLATLVGRDPTLTGRTAIWHQVWLAIARRPWLGYGFSAFWRGTKGASFEVVVALRFVLFHAHNGFLEIWLELGLLGLLLFLVGYFRGWVRLWPSIRAGRYAFAAWPIAVLVLVAAYDFDENTLLSFNGLFWVLYVQAIALVELGAREHARQPAPRRVWAWFQPPVASAASAPLAAAWGEHRGGASCP